MKQLPMTHRTLYPWLLVSLSLTHTQINISLLHTHSTSLSLLLHIYTYSAVYTYRYIHTYIHSLTYLLSITVYTSPSFIFPYLASSFIFPSAYLPPPPPLSSPAHSPPLHLTPLHSTVLFPFFLYLFLSTPLSFNFIYLPPSTHFSLFLSLQLIQPHSFLKMLLLYELNNCHTSSFINFKHISKYTCQREKKNIKMR